MVLADVFGRNPLELWLLAGLVLVMLAVLARRIWRNRTLGGRGDDMDPFLVFPEDSVHRQTPTPARDLLWHAPARESSPAEADRPQTEAQRTVPVPAEPPPETGAGYRLYPSDAPFGLRPHAPPISPLDETSETVRLPTAADGTVQLLPGMFVMTVGPEVGREYRFLRMGGQAVPELTIGRATGPAYRHIHLAAATVSRMHARIRFEGGSWHIANLSATNPLRVNGQELLATQEATLLDGDRVELGEVELSYRNGRT